MDNLKALIVQRRLARAHLAGCEIDLGDTKRQLDKANLANAQLHAGLQRRKPGMRTVFVAEAIFAHKEAVDKAFGAWCEAGQAKDRAMARCCELACQIRKLKASELP